jgi:hypothetical protein
MGKNFSCNNVGGKRKESDFYETPYALTRLFLDTKELSPNETTLEPACGMGAITRILREYKFGNVISGDIQQGQNFLDYKIPVHQVITNPPYSLAYEFIQQAKQIALDKICFLLPLSYLHGKQRFDEIWSDKTFPLKKVYVFTRYPMLGEELRNDGKHSTGMVVFAWYVWQRAYKGNPEIAWLDNNAYVLKHGE